MKSIESISTPRLIGTRIQESDFETLCTFHSDPRVMATLGGVRSRALTARYLRGFVADWEKSGFGLWMFHRREDGAFVGRGGLKTITLFGNQEVELGYSLAAEYWGRGLATEIAQAAIAIGFTTLALDEIIAFTLETNRASRRVMEKAGFHFERHFMYEHGSTVLYRMQRTDYEQSGGTDHSMGASV